MRCKNCGADIPEGMLICPDCRTEVQIVPDYNPLDDVITRDVREYIEDATRPIQSNDVRRYSQNRTQQEYGNPTRVLNQGEMSRIRAQRSNANTTSRIRSGNGGRPGTGNVGRQQNSGDGRQNGNARRNTGNMRQTGGVRRTTGNMRQTGDMRRNTGNMRQTEGMRRSTGNMRQTEGMRRNTGSMRQTGVVRGTADLDQNAEERRRKQAEKKRLLAKKRRRNILLTLFIVIGAVGISAYLIYQNSYSGIIKKAETAFATGDYSAAENYYSRAIGKSPNKTDAYIGLSKVYIQQEDLDQAERVYLSAIDSQPENADLYEAAIQFYIDTDQANKIAAILDGCSQSVLDQVSEYVSDMPAFSLEEGTYSLEQEVTLTGDGDIYYTMDGSEPTEASTKYTEPILLKEGTVVIKAICINEKGVPSLVATRTYTVEIPAVDAPAVTPSTGQYDTATQITINVPNGYTAYYTMDGTTPSTASAQYTGPIDMPEGQTIFSAILVSNSSGKASQVTKRNYVLQY